VPQPEHPEQDEEMWGEGEACYGPKNLDTPMSQSTVDCTLTGTNQFEYLLETLEDRNGSKPLVKEANLNQQGFSARNKNQDFQ
jgi:hypothetical protein